MATSSAGQSKKKVPAHKCNDTNTCRRQETRNCGQEGVKIEHTEGSSKTTGDKELQARRLRD